MPATNIMTTLLSIISIILAWLIGSYFLGADLLPAPNIVFTRFLHEIQQETLLFHTSVTLGRVLLSFVIAMLIGIALGLVMGSSQHADQFLDPWLVFFLNIPALVVIILAYMWLGLNEVAAIGAVAINKIPNVIVTIREGVRARDINLMNMAKVYESSRWKSFRHVLLPQLLPYLAASSRSGISLIWKIVLVVELLGRSNGIGFQLHLYFQLFDIAGILACALIFVLIMQAIELLILRPLERHANRWR
tara:strand:- start:24150 stop:24893 length:744 start_codon:yes stop_codon:yes gene_type:complete